jgi:hypothetical protein
VVDLQEFFHNVARKYAYAADLIGRTHHYADTHENPPAA